MKTIYVNKDLFKEAMEYLNRDITFYDFISYSKNFLKQLLSNPTTADIDPYLKEQGLNRKEFISLLMDKGIIERETKLINLNDSDKLSISYKIPKRNFDRKMRRLFAELFEKNEISESLIYEDGEGGGGATSCASAMQGEGSKPEAGQFVTKVGDVQRKNIYVTPVQAGIIKEMGTCDAGNYQYDVPLNFNNGNDPAFNHNDLIGGGIPKKKKTGVRRKK